MRGSRCTGGLGPPPRGRKRPSVESSLSSLGRFRGAVPGRSKDARGRGRGGARPAPGGWARTRLRPLSAGEPSRSHPARSRLSVSVPPLPPGTVELGPPFAWEFCSRLGSAVTSQRAGPAATMVAKDYPFYLTVKRANCSLEVPPASSPVKDAEVGSPPGPLWVHLSVPLSVSISQSLGSLSVSVSLCLHLSFGVFLFLSLPLLLRIPLPLPISHTHCLPPCLTLSLPPFCPFSVDHHEPPPLSLSPFLLAREQLAASSPLPLASCRALRLSVFCLDPTEGLSLTVSLGPDVSQELPFKLGLPLAWVGKQEKAFGGHLTCQT